MLNLNCTSILSHHLYNKKWILDNGELWPTLNDFFLFYVRNHHPCAQPAAATIYYEQSELMPEKATKIQILCVCRMSFTSTLYILFVYSKSIIIICFPNVVVSDVICYIIVSATSQHVVHNITIYNIY